jgi:hypothetical protein
VVVGTIIEVMTQAPNENGLNGPLTRELRRDGRTMQQLNDRSNYAATERPV